MRTRPAEPRDYDAFAGLFAELGVPEGAPPRVRWEASLAGRTRVAEVGGEIVGYVHFDVLGGVGYVVQLVTAPGARRQGVGRRLMLELAGIFREAGCASFCLNVKPDNEAAIALYASLGMRPAYELAALEIAWTHALALEVPEGVRTRRLGGGDGEVLGALERRFDLPPGRLASRVRAGYVVIALEPEAGGGGAPGPAGVAAFEPSFPGAFPFRVTAPGLAAALLAAMHPFADPAKPTVRVTVEADPALGALLEAAGAAPVLRAVHLRGLLPDEGA